MWTFYVALVAALSGSLVAFPQNNVLSAGIPNSSEVDGFVFDGPISGSNRSTPATTTTTTTTSTTSTMTSTAGVNADDNTACLDRCPTTFEYNPVCGTDNVVYQNPGRLNCATVCGKDVGINYFGPCTTSSGRG